MWYAKDNDSGDVRTTELNYESEEHGFAISYPQDLSYRELASGNVVFGTKSGDTIVGKAETRILTINGTAGESFEAALARELATLCAADSISETFNCTGVDEVRPFVTKDGHAGYQIYLTGEMTGASGDTTPVGKGPFFIVPLRTTATVSKALIIHPPLHLSDTESDSALLTAMAKSVTILSSFVSSPETIEGYVRMHINDLTGEAAQGGNYSVTTVAANSGTGTVTYGNGQNSYTADFTYGVDANGTLGITSFTIQP